MYVLARRFGVVAMTLASVSCTTTPAEFNNKPSAVSKAALCKTALETQDPAFQFQLVSEVNRRGMSMLECQQMVAQQQQAAAVLVGLALVGTAAAVCANGNCGGGAYNPPRRYPGNCQYDWQYDAAGNRCGHRSAYSRPGGW
ncbi:hypothetical protein [Rhizobium leguminosarum]|jgi:hypothetical protein|uniref:hypothetical protein n=1 Tax=Rhizobium leguminosarum TaxID=384 RepID=UPI00102FE5C4|nr:hypothetical protein [Rhizobium leguminosarum]NZD54140.1 hypothetical protein [Rhizobium leguminosarum]TAZ01552.1 hypothetical protein ELH79_08975 [Rhizobium leguminosarum]TAZ12413.1 hypothetical protein ELH78_08975 [Rhizobium leguminosarum]